MALKGYWRIGNVEAVRIEETQSKTQKTLNAKASTGEVTVSGKGVKFSARTVKAESFAV